MQRSMPEVPGKSSPQATDRRSSQSIWLWHILHIFYDLYSDSRATILSFTGGSSILTKSCVSSLPRSAMRAFRQDQDGGWGANRRTLLSRFRSGLLRNRLPTATTAYSVPGVAVHGLMTVMPAARKGASSRVATLNRRDAAMAAIWASATAIE